MSSLTDNPTEITSDNEHWGDNQGKQLSVNNLTRADSPRLVKDDNGRQLLDEQGTQLHSENPLDNELEEEVEMKTSVEIEYVDDKEYDDHGGYKWVVVFSCFIQHFITGGFERSDGVLYLKLINKFHQSAQATAWPGSLSSTIRLCLGPLASIVSNKYSSRVAVIVGGVIMAVGVIISGFAPNLLFLYFSFGVFGGLGRALSYAPGLVTLGQYFAKKPGLAVGLATSGVGAGTFIIPPLFDFLFDEYTFLGAFLILGAIPLNLCVCGALYRPLELHRKIMNTSRRKASQKQEKHIAAETRSSMTNEPETKILLLERNDSKHRTSISNQEETNFEREKLAAQNLLSSSSLSVTLEYTTHVNDESSAGWTKLFQNCMPCKSSTKSESTKPKLLDLSLLKNPPFLLFCFSICLFTLSFKSAFTFLPALAKSQGCTEREAAMLMSVAGIVDTIARILTGFLLDLKKVRKFRPVIYNGLMFFIASLSFLAPSLESFWSFSIMCGLYGALTGAYVSQKSVIIIDILGVEKLSSSLGIMIFFQGIGTLIGPPLSGVLKDVFGHYTEAFYFGGASIILAAIIMIFCNIFLSVQRRKQLQTDGELKQR